MKAKVTIYPRRTILDPQGKAIHGALERLGFAEVKGLRSGKCFEIELSTRSADKARSRLEEMCRKLLANELLEDFEVELLDGASR